MDFVRSKDLFASTDNEAELKCGNAIKSVQGTARSPAPSALHISSSGTTQSGAHNHECDTGGEKCKRDSGCKVEVQHVYIVHSC